MISYLSHLFLPRESNNYRSKLLHHKILLSSIIFIFSLSFFADVVKVNFPSVLGIETSITVDQLLTLTNEKRIESGLSPLVLNPQLSSAATLKANDMFAKDYWAHNSPDGKTPWAFIKEVGYTYTYAGENLARGFNNAEDAVNAWMASPKHRDNILFKNYSEVGFSILTGDLNGQDTVLIVQELGSQGRTVIASNNEAGASSDNVKQPVDISESQPPSDLVVATAPRVFSGASNDQKPILNSLSFFLNLDKALVALFIFVLILDMIVVERKRIIRLVGHNTDHILFLVLISMFVAIFSRGFIL